MLPGALLLLVCAGVAHPSSDRTVAGKREFRGEVVVAGGDTWSLAPGAVLSFPDGRMIVRGRLVARGTPDRPVRIVAGDSFEGIVFRGSEKSVLEHVVFLGGRRGAQVTNAEVAFREVRWERNGIGLDVGQYASVTVDDCLFVNPGRVGMLVRRGGAAAISGTRFTGAGKAGLYVSGAKGVTVVRSRFEENEAGILASMYGAEVSVADTVFRDNGTGLAAEKMALPEVSGCAFAGNRTGLSFSRRSDGTVSGSRIEGNRDGVLVEYSSYPVFRGNRFDGNREFAVRLRNQSSQWEEERGETDREFPQGPGGAAFGGGPGERADFAPGGGKARGGIPPSRKPPLSGTVDFRGNDWGESAKEAEKGEDVAAIHDGRDEPTFEYKGKRYRMDRVLLR